MREDTHVLRTLNGILNLYQHILKNAAETIMDEGVSKYPIFVVSRKKIDMGLLLIDHEKHNSPFSFSASTLEEFVTKKIVEPAKVDSFKQIYTKSGDSLCLFLLDGDSANFIFVPS